MPVEDIKGTASDAARAPVLRCSACDAEFMGRRGDICPKCGQAVGERVGLPWQDRTAKGFTMFGALIRTVWRVQRHPRRAWLDFRPEQQSAEPAAYQLLLLPPLNIVLLLEAYLLMGEFHGGTSGGMFAGGLSASVSLFAILIMLAIILAVVQVIACLLLAAFVHVLARLFAHPQHSASDTYAVLAYGATTPMVWLILPVLAPVAFVMAAAQAVLGLSLVHRIGLIRAGLAALATLLCLAALGAGITLNLM